MIRNSFWATVACLAMTTMAGGQDAPKAELFAGYSYLQANTSGTGFNLNGWESSLTGNVNRWLGLEADFSGHYGSVVSGPYSNLPGFAFLFGPRLTYRSVPRISPFVHVLAGGAYGTSKTVSVILGIPCIVGQPCNNTLTATRSATHLATALGGGIDIKATRRVSVRLIQADWVWANFSGDRQNDPRISTGLVFTFGGR